MIATLRNNLFNLAAFSVLFATIILFAYTGNYFILAAPIVFLYVVLMGVNWKAAYWIFLFTIPASVQINSCSSNATAQRKRRAAGSGLPRPPLGGDFRIVRGSLARRGLRLTGRRSRDAGLRTRAANRRPRLCGDPH